MSSLGRHEYDYIFTRPSLAIIKPLQNHPELDNFIGAS